MNNYRSAATQILRWSCVVALGASLLIGVFGLIWGILFGYDREETYVAMILTPPLGILVACVGIVSASAIEKRLMPLLMWTTVLVAAIAGTGWLAFFWITPLHESSHNVLILRVLGTLSLVAFAMVVSGQLIVQQTASTLITMARLATMGIVCLYLATMVMLMWTSWWHPHDEFVGMVSTIAGLFVLVDLVGVTLLVRASKRRRVLGHETLPSRIALRMTCPKCAAVQTLRTGFAKCSSCRFAMMIHVEEPRCECGYLLYKLQGNTCPECGRAVESTTPAAT